MTISMATAFRRLARLVLLNNRQPHLTSAFWIFCCMLYFYFMLKKLCHLMVLYVMFKWKKLLHFKNIFRSYELVHKILVLKGYM